MTTHATDVSHDLPPAEPGYRLLAKVPGGEDEPVISVIVPTFNRVVMTTEAIESLFDQDFELPYEVVVVDNASTDATAEMLTELATKSPCSFVAVQMLANGGPARSRNAGLSLARGEFVAFTDSDCLPSRGWLREMYAALQFTDIVQGRTGAPPGPPPPFFSHFIETNRLDGSFSTSNVGYRRGLVQAAGGFDPACNYWEDVDLGWRVRRLGAEVAFASAAVVYHQAVPQSPLGWLLHTRRFYNWPAKAARYPRFREHLFLGVWVDWYHALMTALVLGVALSRLRRPFLLLTLPYLVAFPLRYGFSGRLPVLKVVANFARDSVSFVALVLGSLRFRSPVL